LNALPGALLVVFLFFSSHDDETGYAEKNLVYFLHLDFAGLGSAKRGYEPGALTTI
jgi:hypothetical protein